MGYTLEEILKQRSMADFRDQFVLALKGIGWVKKEGNGSGSLSVSGAPVGAYDVRVKISTAGEIAAAQFQYSLDGGVSYSGAIAMAPAGTYVLGSTGVTLQFVADPPAAGESVTSFEVGDIYSFTLAVSTLPVTSWLGGSVPLTMIEKDAEANEDLNATVVQIAKGGFGSTAKGAWCDLYHKEIYDLDRVAGIHTEGNVTLVDAASSGPHTLAAGAFVAQTATGLQYRNMNAFTLNAGATLANVLMRAVRVGGEYNVSGGAITQRVTALPGVTVNNPNPAGGSWITISGRAPETDSQLHTRGKGRWPAVGAPGATDPVYDAWAKAASLSVVQTKVRASPVVPGQVDVIVAGASGPVDGATVTAVQNYIDQRTPTTSVAVVSSAVAFPLSVTGTLRVARGSKAAAEAAVSKNLTALVGGGFNSILEELPGIGIGGDVWQDQFVEQIMLAPGARDLDLSSPADQTLAYDNVIVLTNAISVVEV